MSGSANWARQDRAKGKQLSLASFLHEGKLSVARAHRASSFAQAPTPNPTTGKDSRPWSSLVLIFIWNSRWAQALKKLLI